MLPTAGMPQAFVGGGGVAGIEDFESTGVAAQHGCAWIPGCWILNPKCGPNRRLAPVHLDALFRPTLGREKPELNVDSEVGAAAVARLLPWIGASLPGEGLAVIAKEGV